MKLFLHPFTNSAPRNLDAVRLWVRRSWLRPLDFEWQARSLWDTALPEIFPLIDAFRALDCAGLARVDFFVDPPDAVQIIEVNTLPGFTPISMYPRLWQEAGLSYRDLISRLVDLAVERFEEVRSHA